MNKILVYSLAIFIIGIGVAFRISWIKPETKLPRNQHVTFLATVKTEPKISDRNQVIEIGDSRLYVELFPRYRVGDRLRVSGEVDTKGNIFSGKVEKIGRLQVRDLSTAMGGLREKISKNISQILPSREATLVQGTVLGVDDIERGFRDELIKTGTIHVVVVSGQNLAIVAGLFFSLSKLIGKRLAMSLAVCAVFAYAILTGFEPPVVRACLMVLFSYIAIYYGREKIAVWSLILSALVILFFSPRAIFEVSFQLTFMATFGIVTLGQYLTKVYSSSEAKRGEQARTVFNSLRKGLFQNAAVASSAYIFTAPIIFFYFGRISLIGPVVNVLVAELISPIMILGFLTAAASLIFMPLAQIIAYFAYVPAFIFVTLISMFS